MKLHFMKFIEKRTHMLMNRPFTRNTYLFCICCESHCSAYPKGKKQKQLSMEVHLGSWYPIRIPSPRHNNMSILMIFKNQQEKNPLRALCP